MRLVVDSSALLALLFKEPEREEFHRVLLANEPVMLIANLIEAYRERDDLPLSNPRLALLDLQFHDINRTRSVFYKLQRRDMVERIVTDRAIVEAAEVPPQTTRARLRGEFIKRAKERKRDYTVDWVHLKLNDQAQRTVLCKDPFKAYDDRVDRLIESM